MSGETNHGTATLVNTPQKRKDMNYMTVQQPAWASGQVSEWKKPLSKGHMLFDSIYVTFMKYQNCSDREQSSGCRGLG